MADAASNPYAIAAIPAFASAAIHVAVLPFAPGAETMSMIAGTVIWIALGYGLMRGSRLVGFLAFAMGLFGAVYALSAALTYDGLSALLFGLMSVADALVVAFLFPTLWRSKPAAA